MAFVLWLALFAGQDVASRFEQALNALDAEDLQTREGAQRDIEELPAEALPLAEAALARPGLSPEARARLKGTLPALRLKARRALAAREREHRLAWSRKTVAGDYTTAGRRDPKWDAPAGEALRVMATVWGDAEADVPDPLRYVHERSVRAMEAGCDDPMVHYVRARTYDAVIRKSFPEAVKLHVEAARSMKARGDGYHAIRRAFCYFRAGEFLARSKKQLSPQEAQDARAWLEAADGAFAEGVKDQAVPETLLMEFGEGMSEAWKTLTKDRNPGFDRIVEAVAKARPGSRVPDLLVGRVYVSYAWDARGSGWANSVTEDGWKRMSERLAVAEAALLRAYEQDPLDPEAPTQMLVVELGQGKGRETMELWYDRAMKADPDNVAAAKKKMYYLEPKWHGSAEDMLSFGRELLRGRNWPAKLPFLLTDAHVTLSGYARDRAAYWTQPGVWEDVQAVYEGALEHDPKNDYWRSFYAKLACWCGRYDVARRQFEAVGDRVRTDAFKDKAELDRLRAEASEKGR